MYYTMLTRITDLAVLPGAHLVPHGHPAASPDILLAWIFGLTL